MRVRWTPEAERDRLDIMTYIAGDDPLAAIQMDEQFGAAAGQLADFPEMGSDGIVTGTRELVPHESYRMVYEIHGGTVWVLALVHTSRQWP